MLAKKYSGNAATLRQQKKDGWAATILTGLDIHSLNPPGRSYHGNPKQAQGEPAHLNSTHQHVSLRQMGTSDNYSFAEVSPSEVASLRDWIKYLQRAVTGSVPAEKKGAEAGATRWGVQEQPTAYVPRTVDRKIRANPPDKNRLAGRGSAAYR